MQKIFLAGAGLMGRGIAQVAADSGLSVALADISPELAQKGKARIAADLAKLVEKGKFTPERLEGILNRITPVAGPEAVADCDFVLEAAAEKVPVKQEIFKNLESFAKPDTVFATNTTSCSITEIASAVKNPGRVTGVHFFNPAPLMALVEIMPGLLTEQKTLDTAREFALRLGKDAVVTNKEGPAGISSRVLAGLLNEAVWVLFEGIAGVKEIDRSVMLGCNHKMGPLSLIDLIGIDIHLAKTKMLYEKTGDARYRPCYLLEQMQNAGLLGKKCGRGFYDYTADPPVPMTFSR